MNIRSYLISIFLILTAIGCSVAPAPIVTATSTPPPTQKLTVSQMNFVPESRVRIPIPDANRVHKLFEHGELPQLWGRTWSDAKSSISTALDMIWGGQNSLLSGECRMVEGNSSLGVPNYWVVKLGDSPEIKAPTAFEAKLTQGSNWFTFVIGCDQGSWFWVTAWPPAAH